MATRSSQSHTILFHLVCAIVPSVICFSPQNADLKNLFYSDVTGLLNLQTDRSVPVHPVEVQGWPKKLPNLGQVVGVAVNPNHQPVIFHRGPRKWDETSFNESHHFQYIHEGPIPVDTILTLDSDTGEVIGSWGNNFFYLPHGLTIDNYGYYYMTDVGLHQVFKFKPGSRTPSLVFGQRFEPGSGLHHLCKPTDVAVATTGEIFIADGYCNSRILKYDSNGNLLYIIPQNEELLPLKIPHSITLLQDLDLLCIADRENMRVVCPGAGFRDFSMSSNPVVTVQEPDIGRIYAVTSYNNRIYAVNGPSLPMVQIRGLTIDPMDEAVTDQWTTAEGLQSPHDLEICHNTSSLYVTETEPGRVVKFRLMPLY
ncbi:hypothetical protein RUM43_006154 [Polyplax serrata]|uniref:peptidylamidoglycolate lyase n=1 Tax=Polyplax serrata TaxID=468196 RepID=A0AAN8S3C7_POLSC